MPAADMDHPSDSIKSLEGQGLLQAYMNDTKPPKIMVYYLLPMKEGRYRPETTVFQTYEAVSSVRCWNYEQIFPTKPNYAL